MSFSTVNQILRRLSPLFFVLAFIFIGLLITNHWTELVAQEWRLHWGWLFAGIGLMLISWSVEISIWRYLLGKLGGRLGYWSAVRIWFLSAVVRYVPGNIWQPLGMTLLCRRHGIQTEAVLLSIVLLQVITLLSVLLVAAGYQLISGKLSSLTGEMGIALDWLAGLSIALVLLFVLLPAWFFRLLNWLLVKLGRNPLPMALSSLQLLVLLLVGMGFWLLWGLTFASFTFATVVLSPQQMSANFMRIVAAFPIAYTVGYLSFITPSGLAVREGALYLLLAPVLGGGPTTVAALAIRLWQVILEVVVAGAVGLWSKARGRDIG